MKWLDVVLKGLFEGGLKTSFPRLSPSAQMGHHEDFTGPGKSSCSPGSFVSVLLLMSSSTSSHVN